MKFYFIPVPDRQNHAKTMGCFHFAKLLKKNIKQIDKKKNIRNTPASTIKRNCRMSGNKFFMENVFTYFLASNA